MKYYKITNEEECHNGLQYKDGLNVDPLPFNPTGSCEPGGIYFSREDILAFLDYGIWIREVTLPEDAQVYEDPSSDAKKWKADKVILGPRREITFEVIKELLEEGANVHADNDWALRFYSQLGQEKEIRILVDYGANVHLDEDSPLANACQHGHLDLIEFFLQHGANPNNGLSAAAAGNNIEAMRLLLENGADIHFKEDWALQTAVLLNKIEAVKFLLTNGANVHAEDNKPLKWAKEPNSHLEIIKILEEHIAKETQ